ncbi:hypothetical protein TNCV_642811 [Trichonephila clavipes]|nr:hypothetical protein TNCV_642811 [Trichonephila clavipes]
MQARNLAVWRRLPKRKHPALRARPAVKTRSLPGRMKTRAMLRRKYTSDDPGDPPMGVARRERYRCNLQTISNRLSGYTTTLRAIDAET